MLFSDLYLQNKWEQNAFSKILQSLDHIVPVYVSRQEYQVYSDPLVLNGKNDRFGDFYNLYLPIDLQNWELLELIRILREKFQLSSEPQKKLMSKIHLMTALILRNHEWKEWEKILKNLSDEYRLSQEFIKEVSEISLFSREVKDLIRRTKRQSGKRANPKLEWENDEKVLEKILCEELWKEFNLAFFYHWVNMLRLWMMTITKAEVQNLQNEDGTEKEWVTIRVSPEELDEKEQLLRDKIGIEKYKQELRQLRNEGDTKKITEKELEIANRILEVLHEYPHQNIKNWSFVNSIIENKEILCVGFSVIAHAFFDELQIKHCHLRIPCHSALAFISWGIWYYFDASTPKWTRCCELVENIDIKRTFYEEVSIGLLASMYINGSQMDENAWFKLESINSQESESYINLLDHFSDQYRVVYTFRAEQLRSKWDYFWAINQYIQAIKIDPFAPEIYRLAWITSFSAKEYSLAEILFKKELNLLLSWNNDSDLIVKCIQKYAFYCMVEKLYKPAIHYYWESLKIDPNDQKTQEDILYTIMFLIRDLKEKWDNPEVIVWCDELLKIKPDNVFAIESKAMAYTNMGEHKNAIFWYKKAEEFYPDEWLYIFWIGVLYADIWEYSLALKYLNRRLTMDCIEEERWEIIEIIKQIEDRLPNTEL